MLWPLTTRRDADGQLAVGGIPLSDLAQQFGTPLYVYDEATIRSQIATYRSALERHYPRVRVVYAGKAYLSAVLLGVIEQEGLWLDVVSGGELALAHRAGFPIERVVFHGNNKTLDELQLAIDLGIGEIVVDNHYELDLLEHDDCPVCSTALMSCSGSTPASTIHTHDYRKTGIVDSKFGLPIDTGEYGSSDRTDRCCSDSAAPWLSRTHWLADLRDRTVWRNRRPAHGVL